MNRLMHWLGGLALALTALAAGAQDKVVYHFDNTEQQAIRGLRSIRNHLDVAPDTRIIVVAIGDGIDFLLEGATDRRRGDIDYNALVSDLRGRGVRFEICEITMSSRQLKREQMTMDAEFTPSGVVRLANLQARERYVYIKP